MQVCSPASRPDVRFDPDASDRRGAIAYFQERAWQLFIERYCPVGEPEPLFEAGIEWGLRVFVRGPSHERYQSVYVYAAHRGRMHTSKLLAKREYPVITTPDCDLEAYLTKLQVPFVVAARITDTREYKAISAHYGARVAQRSNVLLMRHIDEGLVILDRIGASERTMRAYCLHPLLQADSDLAGSFERLETLTDDLHVLTLALEYRNIANASLSRRAIRAAAEIPLSPLPAVREMLIADKVQNRRDFIRYHRDTHPRSSELARYFVLWLERLDVDEATYDRLCHELSSLESVVSAIG